MSANWKVVPFAVAMMAMSPTAFADVITDWNENAVTFVTPRMAPPVAQRAVAMVHVAMFDAVNSIERRYRPYLLQLPAPPTTSKEAAAAAAAAVVLAGLLPQVDSQVKGMVASYLAAIPNGDAKSGGIKLGEAVAAKVLEVRAKDGADAPDAYRPKTKPGVYVPTPITVGSTWPDVVPFALKSSSQFRPDPPIALTSARWAADYNEIKDLGAKNSTKRSDRQTEDARFWLITGPQSTDPILRQLVAAKKMSLVDSAHFMALASVALADAYIAVMDAKYHYEFWRPITAIRNGDIDDNSATERDPIWQPIDATPMHPEYPCAHCIGSSTLAAVVEALLGTEDIPDIVMTSPTAPGATHHWSNLRAYTEEVSQARISAGFHYRFSTEVGRDMGRKIGQYVVQNVMQLATVATAH
jgi:Vanadium chloroperoxidase N-terminal domain/PAP2 superfamily